MQAAQEEINAKEGEKDSHEPDDGDDGDEADWWMPVGGYPRLNWENVNRIVGLEEFGVLLKYLLRELLSFVF